MRPCLKRKKGKKLEIAWQLRALADLPEDPSSAPISSHPSVTTALEDLTGSGLRGHLYKCGTHTQSF